MTEKTPWYLIKHRGSKLQGMWQLAVGGSLLLGLVIAPLVSRLHSNSIQRQKLSEYAPGAKMDESIQVLVHKERLKMRAALTRAKE